MTRVLIIGYVFPEPASSAAGTRMMQLLEFFKAGSYTITFATTATSSLFAQQPEEMGISSVKIELNNDNFDLFLKELQPEIVLFDRFMMEEQFGWRVEKICPEAIRILDTEDLHFLRNFREKQFKDPALPFSALKQSEIAKREIASIYRCDLSLIISEVEMELLQAEFNIPAKLLFYLPFLFNKITTEDKATLPNYEEREDFISIGNFRHKPNVDAVIYLKKEIWPLIHKQLPHAKMNVYGAYPTPAIQSLNQSEINFFIKGRAPDAVQVVQKARVSLAALRFGAGLKGKLTEAMLCGTPTITTSIGAEGMCGDLPWNGEIENDHDKFAQAAVSLYNDPVKWQEAAQNGYNIINQRFLKSGFYKSFGDAIANLREQLAHHRRENFTGAMLRHHRVKSTYFLSRYIQVKNELENFKNAEKKPPL